MARRRRLGRRVASQHLSAQMKAVTVRASLTTDVEDGTHQCVARWLLCACVFTVGACGQATEPNDMSEQDLAAPQDLEVVQDLRPHPSTDGGVFGCGALPPWLSCYRDDEYCYELTPISNDGGSWTATCLALPSDCAGMSICDC